MESQLQYIKKKTEAMFWTSHDCEKTITTGEGKPCKKCKERYMEEESKREHAAFKDAKSRTITLNPTDSEFISMKTYFETHTHRGYKALRIDKNNNIGLLQRYNKAKSRNDHQKEALLFHGTPQGHNHGNIFQNGFKLKYARNGTLGVGIYFADDVDYSDSGYCFGTTIKGSEIRTIFICKVLFVPGQYIKNGNIQAIYKEDLCFPEYIVHYGR